MKPYEGSIAAKSLPAFTYAVGSVPSATFDGNGDCADVAPSGSGRIVGHSEVSHAGGDQGYLCTSPQATL